MTSTRAQLAVAVLLAGMLASGCSAVPPDSARGKSDPPRSSTEAAAEVAALPVETLASEVVSRAADDLIPPTNRWYSGIVFGETSERIFPFPLALDVQPQAFTVSLPRVTATATTVEAGDAAGVTVAVPADDFTVVRADPVSVTARYTREGADVGELTTAEGWPVVAFTAAREVTVRAGGELVQAAEGVWSVTIDGQEYGVDAPSATVEGGEVRLPAGATAQWFAVPADSAMSAWADALGDPVTAVSASFAVDGETASTLLDYRGTDATVLTPFPGRETGARCDLGTFATAFGTVHACAATSLEWSVKRQDAAGEYDFAALDAETRTKLLAQLDADLSATVGLPADTYFGGKALARLGAMLSLARSLGDRALEDRIADRLETEFEPWTEPSGCLDRTERCFVYDDRLRLVVGRTPSFGSEEGNDHHFHFGYFLSAAAALAEARPDAVEDLAPMMDVLAADIAAGAGAGILPELRVFDPYRGHSWASGFSPFASGNNQESSSEAVAAWNGLALWAKARGDEGLEQTATWLLSAEADAARKLWLEPDGSDLPEGYAHEMVSLTWGSKRDYATWFSAEPSAILGIQVLPIGPLSLESLAGDPDRIAQKVTEAGGDAAFTAPLGEYVLAYSALASEDARTHAEEIASQWDAAGIDDGTSLSLLLAWLAAVRLAEDGSP